MLSLGKGSGLASCIEGGVLYVCFRTLYRGCNEALYRLLQRQIQEWVYYGYDFVSFLFFSSGIFGADGGAATAAKLMQGEGVSRCVDLCWFWGEGANQV